MSISTMILEWKANKQKPHFLNSPLEKIVEIVNIDSPTHKYMTAQFHGLLQAFQYK